MKTNKRSKRVKKMRRNRRSRRTQRGGGEVNEIMRHYKDLCQQDCDAYITLRPGGPDRYAFDRCIEHCDERFPQDVPHDGSSKATSNGWYVDYFKDESGAPCLQMLHVSWPPLKTIYHIEKLSYHITMRIIANLDKMPDPTKTYGFDSTKWKITYDAARLVLQWENQTDQSKQPFDIESPLKIGDKMATESA